MGGGYFNYNNYHLSDFVTNLNKGKESLDPEDRHVLDEVIIITELAEIMLYRADMLLSGDDSVDDFKEKLRIDLRNKGFSGYGTNTTSFPDRTVIGFSKKIKD